MKYWSSKVTKHAALCIKTAWDEQVQTLWLLKNVIATGENWQDERSSVSMCYGISEYSQNKQNGLRFSSLLHFNVTIFQLLVLSSSVLLFLPFARNAISCPDLNVKMTHKD